MIEIDEVVNKAITDLHISYVEPKRRPGYLEQTTTPSTSPWEIQTTVGDKMGRRLEQRHLQVETLVSVLLIEDGDKKELWCISIRPEDAK